MGTVYLIRNTINGKCYIGKTINNPKRRIWEHLNCTTMGNRLIRSDVEKFGIKSFVSEYLHEGISGELLDTHEIEAIKTHNTLAPNGYNLTKGGEGRVSANMRIQRKASNLATKALRKSKSDLKKQIGNSLTVLMERDEISRYKLAKDLGVSEAQINRIQNGIYAPSLDLFISIADYFKVSTDYLYGRK